jgi:hypothetical protein
MELDAPAMNDDDQRYLAGFRSDPVRFARSILRVEPWEMQREVLARLSEHPRVAVAGAHGVGKDHVAATAVLHFLYTRPRSVVLTTAPTERQVKSLLWGEIRRQWACARVPLGGTFSAARLDLKEGGYAFGFSTNETERFQGFHAPAMLIVIDEAAGVSREIFEAADACLAGDEARLLLLGNPTRRSGRFFEAFSDPAFSCLRIPATEHPNVTGSGPRIPGAVTREWIDRVCALYGETSMWYRSRVLAEFPEQDSEGLMAPEWIERAFALETGAPGPVAIGADVARFGNDSTVVVVAEGGTVREIVSARKRALVVVADIVESAIRRHRVSPEHVHIDDTGLGGGVTDILRDRDLAVRGIQFGARARAAGNFRNVKAELHWRVRSLLEHGGLALARVAGSRDGVILREQLGLLRVEYSDDGRVKVTGDPGHAAAPSTSPDHADALALAMAALGPLPPAGDFTQDPASTDPATLRRRSGMWLG